LRNYFAIKLTASPDDPKSIRSEAQFSANDLLNMMKASSIPLAKKNKKNVHEQSSFFTLSDKFRRNFNEMLKVGEK
jgi:hypothetical protein